MRLDPTAYDGEALCPCCGGGMDSGTQYKGCTEGVTHEESCAVYTWADDLCASCDAELKPHG